VWSNVFGKKPMALGIGDMTVSEVNLLNEIHSMTSCHSVEQISK